MSNSFYSNSTLIAIALLCVLIITIIWLLINIRKVVDRELRKESPDAIEPSFFERKIKPVTSKWNPTIVTIIVLGVVGLALGGWAFDYGLKEVGVQQGYAPEQPIKYDHKLHAGKLDIDCQYCHSIAAKSRHASIPSMNVCMNCHKAVSKRDDAGNVNPEIQKIYDAVGWDAENAAYDPKMEKKPIKWVRIHNLPDLAYFNHSQHVAVGNVECQTCHGEVQEMEKVAQHATLQMGWCVNCHRERNIDPENEYYNELHEKLKKQEDRQHYITVAKNGGLDCAACHY